ncbi:hypothetical protein IFO70_14510 [Phormidium tenue FACHB-886]|nr:hypothetical protein [Phormidium tenue FACHB-886]
MTLTAGATLQGSKYVIQARLHQSDFGVSYKATHTLLNQPVVLQTLNPVVRQRADFAAVRQQFIEGARSLSYRETVRVLDCFEEEGLPVVVLQPIAGQEPLKLSDWLQLSPEPSPQPTENASANAPTSSEAEAALPKEPSEPPTEQLNAKQLDTEQLDAEQSDKAAPKADDAPDVLPVLPAPELPASAVPSPQTTQATVPVAPKSLLLPSLPTSKSRTRDFVEPSPKRKLPMALVITALVGLGLGAGTGLALRYQSVPQSREAGANTPRSAPSLFSREQSFPPEGGWPIEEVPNLFPTEPKVEEPVYRSAPVPDYYNTPYYSAPPVQPLEVKPYSPPPSSDSVYDSQSLPDLAPGATPIEPLPKADTPLSAPKGDVINTAPPAAASEPAPIPPLPPLEPIAPAPAPLVPAEPLPAQSPKGLPPIVTQ